VLNFKSFFPFFPGPERKQLSTQTSLPTSKTIHKKEKLKKFVTTNPALQKILKALLHIEEETRVRQVDSRKNKPF
jgi:sporulation-control protein spo0M